MLTLQTQLAISVLHSIASGGKHAPVAKLFSAGILSELLDKLEKGKIIQPIPGRERGNIESYELARPTTEICLLDILEATGEHLDCNRPATEEFYSHNINAIRKLGIVNQMTRLYLENIKLNDL